METTESADEAGNLAQLQGGSLKVIARVAVAIAYVWLLWLGVPGRLRPPPAGLWIGMGLLMLSGVGSHVFYVRRLRLAAHLLVWGFTGTVACVAFVYPSPVSACLFVLPVIISSLLLSQRGVGVVTIAAVVLIPAANWPALRAGLLPGGLLGMPLAVLVALTCWLSVRNLHIALAWTWHGFQRAIQNEQVARERQAELRRTLKALDEASYRLERTNYMLNLARDQAEEARRLKQSFAQTISHELRTPLNLIVGFTELMTESPQYYGAPLPSIYLRDLRIVHRNACHLQNLVNDVLDLARIDAAQMSLLPEETDPATLVQEAANTVRALVESRGLTLAVSADPDLPPLWVDPVRIRQVLFNLLSNAARFTEHGGITVRVGRQDDEVRFAVADTGVGIAPADLPRVFEEFQQLDDSPRRQHSGAGLGLAISRRFVEMHGGRIWVESQVGRGSTFHFSLPTRGRVLAATAEHTSSEPRQAAPPHQEPVLLAVTRSPSGGALLARYVRGCRTVVVRNLEQGRQAAQRLMPQAVVIDAACEAVDAPDLAGLARSWGLPRVPFVACPLPGEEPLRQRLTVDGYLVKPVTQQGLADILRQFGAGIDSILIIDDDRDFVQLLLRLLDNSLRRYQVGSASSGEEALERMAEQSPDLVLLDLALPGMDGLQVIERIRSAEAWRHIPIVVVSAQEEIDNLEAMAGAMLIARAEGLRPGEVVQWVQKALDTTMLR